LQSSLPLMLKSLNDRLQSLVQSRIADRTEDNADCRLPHPGNESNLEYLSQHGSATFGDQFDDRARILVTELREAECRAEHGAKFSEREIFRVLDSIHELVDKLEIEAPSGLDVVRRASLRRLYYQTVRQTDRSVLPAAILSTAYILSAIGLSAFTIRYVESPTSWFLTGTAWLIFGRLAHLAAVGDARLSTSS